ncbi:MAG: hypothetical protein FJ096_12425, partial [Deltaproteobacteria bacterium]|nr:hypothetical protein [Deltaproteobacteria bacterium]
MYAGKCRYPDEIKALQQEEAARQAQARALAEERRRIEEARRRQESETRKRQEEQRAREQEELRRREEEQRAREQEELRRREEEQRAREQEELRRREEEQRRASLMPEEGLINTPLPLSIALPEDYGIASVTLRYKSPASNRWLKLPALKLPASEGRVRFGAIVPCKDTKIPGPLRFHFIPKDDGEEPILLKDTGSVDEPFVVELKGKIDGAQPSFPGKRPPTPCRSAEECPPDDAVCNASKSVAGDSDKVAEYSDKKGWGANCDSTSECRSGLTCKKGVCEQGGDAPPPEEG